MKHTKLFLTITTAAIIAITLLLPLNRTQAQAQTSEFELIQTAIDHLNLTIPDIGIPGRWSYQYAPATSDSSLGCGLIEGQTLSRMVVPYQITLFYDGLPYVYFISGDGTILVPCDTKIPGVVVTSTSIAAANTAAPGVGGPIAQPDITVTDAANTVATPTCLLTAIYANIRQQPDETALILGQLTTGQTNKIIGNQLVDNRLWWQLESGGWVASWVSSTIGTGCISMPGAEITTTSGASSITQTPTPNNDSNFTCAEALTPRLTVGAEANTVSGLPNNVRNAPGLSGSIIGQIDNNTTFAITNGPVCEDGFVWWEVQLGDLIGWTAEGNGSTYWLEPNTA